MQAYHHGKAAFVRQHLQDGQQLDLALDVKERRRLVQKDHFRLLAQRARQQDALALAVADTVEIPVGKGGSAHQLQRLPHLLPVLIGQNAQPPGVGVTPGGCKVKTGSQLYPAAVGHHQRQFAGAGGAGAAGKRGAVQKHCPAHGRQLPCQRPQQGGFARAVGADEGKDLPGFGSEGDVPQKRGLAVADGKGFGSAEHFFLHRAPS